MTTQNETVKPRVISISQAFDEFGDLRTSLLGTFSDSEPERPVSEILLPGYRRLLEGLTISFGGEGYHDPTAVDFRDCRTPLNILHLMQLLKDVVSQSSSGSIIELKKSIDTLLDQACQFIRSDLPLSPIARRRRLIATAGMWPIGTEMRSAALKVCNEFDRLQPELQLPPGWEDPTLRKRGNYDSFDAAMLTAESIFESLVKSVGPDLQKYRDRARAASRQVRPVHGQLHARAISSRPGHP